MPRFNSSINVIGSIPDYGVMIDYIVGKYRGDEGYGAGFKFRTEKSFKRFDAAIDDAILKFKEPEHQNIFYDALSSESLPMKDKLMVVFWQLISANELFHDITANVFMPAVYDGRTTMHADEILSYLRYLKESDPQEMTWSEATLKIVASKYLTILKKLGLAEGATRKSICHPSIPAHLFIYFVRWAAISNDERRVTIDNPYLQFGFYDRGSLVSRLKKLEFTPYWDIAQIGEDITIELKPSRDANI